MGWADDLREGFEELDLFQAYVSDSKWVETDPQFGKQLELVLTVEAIQEPADASIPESYRLWYGMGKKGSAGWDIIDNGDRVWSAHDSQIIKTSKLGMLLQRVVELNAPLIQLDWHDATIWKNFRAIFKRESLIYKGLQEEQDISLPIQILAPTGIVETVAPAAVATISAPPAPVSPPPSSPPPPVSSSNGAIDFRAQLGSQADGWFEYIVSIVSMKPVSDAKMTVLRDNACQPNSIIMNGAQDNSIFTYLMKEGKLQVINDQYIAV